jgi:Lon protease-like protein
MAVMPMFPLGTPLLPGAILPLHVFEPRYRQMVQDILADDVDPPEFGVVMIERGREVGGGDARSMIGTIARIVDIEVTPDGRFALVVVAWLPDDPYPLADVDRWPDDDTGAVLTTDTIEALHARVREINGIVREIGEMAPPPDAEISDDPRLALFHLAALSPLGAADRQRILASPGSAERVVALREALDDAAAVLEFRRA